MTTEDNRHDIEGRALQIRLLTMKKSGLGQEGERASSKEVAGDSFLEEWMAIEQAKLDNYIVQVQWDTNTYDKISNFGIVQTLFYQEGPFSIYVLVLYLRGGQE